jgi:phospholipid/cholesterol/gamma-HCH transport system substrate-binding protein
MNNELKQTLSKVSKASDSTNDAFKEFEKLIKDGHLDLANITEDSLKKFDIIMLELERTMQNAQKSIENLNDSPSDIIFKSRSIDFGPGEKNED